MGKSQDLFQKKSHQVTRTSKNIMLKYREDLIDHQCRRVKEET